MSSSQTAQYGLSSDAITAIQAVLKKHPKVSKAILYGSRAKGNYRPASDIDLTLQGEQLDYAELVKIDNELDDLLLPYTIDLSIYQSIENADLIDHIKRVGQVFYSRK
ncbi:MAG: nucleotidyltransferase domain-containing protein [Gammaproteobacteria bacterium]|nr:nucleotidyltransferase domain-containing protein [Gammaproteobacteria bacterium]